MSDDEAGAPAPRVALVLLSVGVSQDQARRSVEASLADDTLHSMRAFLAEARAQAQALEILVEARDMQREARPGGADAGGAGGASADDEEVDELEDALEDATEAVNNLQRLVDEGEYYRSRFLVRRAEWGM